MKKIALLTSLLLSMGFASMSQAYTCSAKWKLIGGVCNITLCVYDSNGNGACNSAITPNTSRGDCKSACGRI